MTTTTIITNDMQYIDSRDLIDRAQELLEQFVPVYNDHNSTDSEHEELEIEDALHNGDFRLWLQEWSDDERGELLDLLMVWRECEHVPDWTYGQGLIREDYFTEYSKDMLQDCGDIPKDVPSYVEIDWEKTADNLKVDYMEVEFKGVTYFIRSV